MPPPEVVLVPDLSSSLNGGVAVRANVRARLFGLKLLRLEADVVLVPATTFVREPIPGAPSQMMECAPRRGSLKPVVCWTRAGCSQSPRRCWTGSEEALQRLQRLRRHRDRDSLADRAEPPPLAVPEQLGHRQPGLRYAEAQREPRQLDVRRRRRRPAGSRRSRSTRASGPGSCSPGRRSCRPGPWTRPRSTVTASSSPSPRPVRLSPRWTTEPSRVCRLL